MTPDQGPDQRLPEQRPKPWLWLGVALFLAMPIVLAAIEDGPDGFPTKQIKANPRPATQRPWMNTISPITDDSDPFKEIVVDVPTPIVVPDHCQSTLEECQSKAKIWCNERMGLPPNTPVSLAAVSFKKGVECAWTCPSGLSATCLIGPTPAPQPRPIDTASTP